MLTFIVPLKSPEVSKCWISTSRMFERTLSSLCGQVDLNFQVIVVCNKIPEVNLNSSKVKYVRVDFPVPGKSEEERELDRTRKVLIGIEISQEKDNSGHIMVVDADDCVSRSLSGFIDGHRDKDGWLISEGFFYKDGSNWIRLLRKGFDRYCGSSNIVRSNYLKFPADLDEIQRARYYIDHYTHRKIEKTLSDMNCPLEKLPFRGAVYIQHADNLVLGTREIRSISVKSRFFRLKSKLDYRPLSNTIREEFNIYS